MAPFHIKAQILRQAQLEPAAALGVFAERTGGADVPSPTARPTGKAGWRQSDVKRVLAAAGQAGLHSYRVEVAPDGTISLIVGEPAATAPPPPDSRDDRLAR